MENSTGSTIGTVSGRRKNKGRSGEDGHRIGPRGRGGRGALLWFVHPRRPELEEAGNFSGSVRSLTTCLPVTSPTAKRS